MDLYQLAALDIAVKGHNLLILGQAGSGKTFLINNIFTALSIAKKRVAITATTGIASTHLCATSTTIHKWAGLEDGRHTEPELVHLIRHDERFVPVKNRITNTDVLIIDEVSMFSKELLCKVEHLCRTFNDNSLYFGGLQVILCGDIFQLPPVPNTLYGDHGHYFFTAKWFTSVFHIVKLKQIHRQTDVDFISIINDISKGIDISDETETYLKSLSRELNNDRHVSQEIFHLYATNLYKHIIMLF